MMDPLHQEMLSDSAFESMMHSELTLSNPFASLPSPAFHSRLDFSDRLDDEDLFGNIQGPIATAAGDCHKDLTTRLRRRKASQPQRLVYCDLNFTARDDAQNNGNDQTQDREQQQQEPGPGEKAESSATSGSSEERVEEKSADSKERLTCGSCEESFPDRKSLRSHQKSHPKQKCVCPVCHVFFFNKTVLKNHIKRIHERPERSFGCDVCGKKFVSKPELTQHTFIHSEEKRFSCPTCDKKFAAKPYLERHQKTHTGVVKSYVCTICDKRLVDKTGFTAHVRAHNNERPFACSECDKRYTIKRHLTSHMRIHSSVRPFRCPEPDCGKTFRSRSNLRQHKDFHAGVKRWTCSHCSRSFLSQGNMAKHVRRHIGLKNHCCDVCGKGFIEKQELRSHQKVHMSTSADSAVRDSSDKPAVQKLSRCLSSTSSQDQESNACDVSSTLTPDSMVMITVIDDPHAMHGQEVLATEVQSFPGTGFMSSPEMLSPADQRLPSISSFNYTNSSMDEMESVFHCTLCSSFFHQANELRDHLLNYHRVESDKIL